MVYKREFRLLACAFVATILLFLLLNTVNAEIVLSQPKQLYNLGDDLSLDIKLSSASPGYLDVNLVCPNGQINIYHNVPNEVATSFSRKLTPAYIGNLSGICSIIVSYGSELKETQKFQISNLINLELQVTNLSYPVGKELKIGGTAIKENSQLAGQGFPAFIKANFGNITFEDMVKDGQFIVNFTIPESTKAGNYALYMEIYDKDESGNILNSGRSSLSIQVTQLPSKTDSAVDKLSLLPGETANIIPFLYDKAGDAMNSQVLVRVEDIKSKVLFEGYLSSNQNFAFQVPENNTPGLNKIIVQKDNLVSEKLFEIKELKRITPEIVNQTLILRNSGNVPYVGLIQVKIADQTVLKEISLQIGEKAMFELSAPNGQYDIALKDDYTDFLQSGVALTGNAIGVRDIRERAGYIFLHYPVAWIFVLLVLVFFLVVWIRKYRQEKKFHFTPYDKGKNSPYTNDFKKGGVQIIKPEPLQRKVDSAIINEDIRKAEQVLVLHGSKSQVGIIAIKIKNNIAGIARDNLNKALEYAYERKGVSYLAGNYVLLIFSPLLTRSQRNDILAVKAAADIDNFLREHNRKFRNDLINYGIGLNSGELINALEGKTLQFANIGRTISAAKKIAEIASQELLLSKEIHDKTSSDIKVDKLDPNKSRGLDLFSIKRIVNTEQSQKFIQGFLRRN